MAYHMRKAPNLLVGVRHLRVNNPGSCQSHNDYRLAILGSAQIRESVQQSFDHLKVDYLDALILHAPFEDEDDNLVASKVFETFVPQKVRCLGVSNVSLQQLQKIYYNSSVKPVIVQNRFYKDTLYDLELRAFCKDHGITYQAYWMLKHNPEILESELLGRVSEKLDVEKELAFYILILGLGGTQVLDGTTKLERMEKDVQTATKILNDDQLLKELQPDLLEWRKLLWRLAGSTLAAKEGETEG